jgi:hypothetical protein
MLDYHPRLTIAEKENADTLINSESRKSPRIDRINIIFVKELFLKYLD